MFDQILGMVKEHLGNNPQVQSAIPAGKEEAVHQDIAQHIQNGLATQATEQGGVGSMLSKLQNAATSGSPVVNAIEGGLVSSLASKFGLPPMATGAIAAALPGLLQKFAHKANDPNDHSVTPDGISGSLSKLTGGLGSMFGK